MPRKHLGQLALTALCIAALAACTGDSGQRPPLVSNPASEQETEASKLAAQSDAGRPGPARVEERSTGDGLAAPLRSIDRSAINSQLAMPATTPVPSIGAAASDRYAEFADAGVKRAIEHPISTFSADVDTAAYANVRRFLMAGQKPPRDAVRVEEMINYFDYDYPAAGASDQDFTVHTEIAPSPWAKHTHLLKIGIQARDLPAESRPAANLVFLIDVSGSMRGSDRLPLLQQSLRLLIQRLRAEDRLAIVVYAGAAGLVLESTTGADKARMLAALDGLAAGGSTNGGDGIRLAYAVAREHASAQRVSRVILATDGDFNVGTVNQRQLLELVERERQNQISLSVLGFGRGNYNDALMESLSNSGDGNAAYIDTLMEANKVLVRELDGTLYTLARDLKIQIEFNPAQVAEYRLVGYENRHLQREDFNNDRVDAGDVGAGHRVTALYEIRLQGRPGSLFEPLRYAASSEATSGRSQELAHVRLRYKRPDQASSRLIEQSIDMAQILPDFDQASTDLRFAAAVAGFGQWLRGGRYLQAFDPDSALAIARAARGEDRNGERAGFVGLLDLSRGLQLAGPGRQQP